MNYREYNVDGCTVCLPDGALGTEILTGGKLLYPVEIELACSEYVIAKTALERSKRSAQTRLNSEKNVKKHAAVMERLNGICACLLAMEHYSVFNSCIELEDENELDTLIHSVQQVKGKEAKQLDKWLDIFRG